jgi:hypothetical protein
MNIFKWWTEYYICFVLDLNWILHIVKLNWILHMFCNRLKEWSRWKTCKNSRSFWFGHKMCIVNKIEVVSRSRRLDSFNGCNFCVRFEISYSIMGSNCVHCSVFTSIESFDIIVISFNNCCCKCWEIPCFS